MRKLQWQNHMTQEEKWHAVEAARILGFYTTAARFPVVSEDEGTDIRKPLADIAVEAGGEVCTEDSRICLDAGGKRKALPEGYISALESARECDGPEFRTRTGLELLFSEGLFLKDTDHDFLPDCMDVKFMIPDEAPDELWKAACELAFRLGMETTAYEGTLRAPADWKGNTLVFQSGKNTGIRLESRDPVRVIVEGEGQELLAFTACLCNSFPLLPDNRTWQDAMMEMTDSFAMKNLDGELAAAAETDGAAEAYVSPEFFEKEAQWRQAFPEITFYNYKSGKVIYEKEYHFPWEKDTLEALLEEQVYPKLQAGDQIEVLAAVSEDEAVRREIAAGIRQKAEDRGAVIKENQILCAYKQGFSWIREAVLPGLVQKDAARVIVYFKPFLPEGETQWLDENGATPSYHNLGADNPDKWYDLPIRYLQELYPVEDVITEELHLAREQVEFRIYDGEEDLTYLLVAEKADGEEICRKSYQAAWAERLFLDEYPRMGKVHPSTGYVKVRINGAEILNQRIRTDLEYIWDAYQKEVLPDCRKYVEERFGKELTEDMQPFFNELRLDVTVSEPDERLGSREDLLSSLDALHEDMYFVGTDYFKNIGVETNGAILDAPGLILPLIHKKEGAPCLKVTLLGQLRQNAAVEQDGKVLHAPGAREEAETYVTALGWEGGALAVQMKTEAASSTVRAYAALTEKGLLEGGTPFGSAGRLYWEAEGERITAQVPYWEETEKTGDISRIDLCENRLIGYEQYLEIMEQLKNVPGISVFQAARSYMGRKIYAIEVLPREEGYVSRTKRLTAVPSEIVNTRHHANEVSGTNAIFLFLRKLLTEKTYEMLPDHLNLVLVPMENPDGTAIHYELQKEHPYWKFHVARFSAIGKEFSRGYFKKDTIHREAMAVTRLFYKYLPDIFVDNHGVPSHEWEQQFSGYTSPSYKGFWLPRSLLYGYFWYVTEEGYQWNYRLNKVMEDRIADKIAEDAEMTRWNIDWAAQFEKYAHAWMPKLFPAEYYKNMINYWIPFQWTKGHHYSSVSFPWITSVSYTSEVADETAQEAYLGLCAGAHVAHDEATAEMLAGASRIVDCGCRICDYTISMRQIRQRPVLAE